MSSEILEQYVPTIGIECHVQLKTRTKLFAAVNNDARDAAPNTLISHICLGMPGALPVLNEKAVEYAMQVAFAFNTKPQKYSHFERKHYFYPDLPKGYQITQLSHPIIVGGHVDLIIGKETRRIRINRVQIEEDAGKSTHPAGKDFSLVDLNRAGTPLLEIVSEADIHSPAEAKLYARELWLLMRYAGVSDADLYQGNMRFDVNVSVSKTGQLGLRTETKNLNSFRSVEKATDYEIKRQIEQLEKGESIIQETRGWDDAKQKTFSQRSKEDAHDYRYFPDPDIPPVELSDTAIETVAAVMPVLPARLRERLSELAIDQSAIETLIEEMPAGKLIITLLDSGCNSDIVKRIANWLVTEVQGLLTNEDMSWENLKLNAHDLIVLAEMAGSNKVSSTGAKVILSEMVVTGGGPEKIATEKNILQVSDEGEIAAIVGKVLADNPQAATDVKNGEIKAIGFLVGQVMKLSQGKANPGLAKELIKKQLGI
ncbi:MAG TPA: Asp-tRNA(Asn)/Glu-tRNA(Gln) amidotransferase subunit GatB [Candidatus Limnocylindrales bacterium]|nr:Asp-tRNA(Asn)/Glu-tRNA(Gln) amidotransferase subunit GatB [Candidatus Limnocylindrales bacterium]